MERTTLKGGVQWRGGENQKKQNVGAMPSCIWGRDILTLRFGPEEVVLCRLRLIGSRENTRRIRASDSVTKEGTFEKGANSTVRGNKAKTKQSRFLLTRFFATKKRGGCFRESDEEDSKLTL